MATYVNKRDLDTFKKELGVDRLGVKKYTRGEKSNHPGTTGCFLGKVDANGNILEPVAYCSETMAADYVKNGRFTIDCVIGDTEDGACVLIKAGGGKADGFC